MSGAVQARRMSHKMFSKTLLIFLIANVVSDSCGQRDKKFFRKDYTFIEAEESFYKIHTVPLTWAEAKRVCALEGATFWHPDNDDEAHAVISLWKKVTPKINWMYVGLSDILVEGAFQTVEGKPITEVYSSWESNEPNNSGGNENCVHISKEGDMNDVDCSNRRLTFTCKKSLKLLEWNHNCNISNLDYTLNKDIGKCYKLHTTPLKWTEANAMCQLEESNLAVINNRLEAEYLVKLTESIPKPRVKGKYQRGIYHLGFHNRLNDGWQTVKGIPLNIDADAWFDNYQPDGDAECGSMFYTGRLINTDCEMKSFFICEHELDKIITPASAILTNSEQPFLHPYVGGGIA